MKAKKVKKAKSVTPESKSDQQSAQNPMTPPSANDSQSHILTPYTSAHEIHTSSIIIIKHYCNGRRG
jgi:hypothetical protein